MKKFGDAKAPLGQIKFKLQIKANQQQEYQIFYKEIDTIIKEQTKFTEKIEFAVAGAEALDPVQACIF